MRYAPIQLEHADELSFAERIGVGRELVAAVKAEGTRLQLELPLVARNYGSLLRAVRRLGTVSNSGAHPDLLPFVIRNHDYPAPCYTPDMVPGRVDGVIGMATIQKLRSPGPLHGWTELSYWHARSPRHEVNVAMGNAAVQQLRIHSQGSSVVPLEEAFMVTLPYDTVKSEALANQGFVPEGEPQHYDLQDGVTARRQLWVPKA